MKGREYLKLIQRYGNDSHECREQASALKDALNRLSDEETICTIKTLIDKLMEKSRQCNMNRQYMIAQLSNITEPMQYMVLLYRYQRNYHWSDIAYKLRTSEKAVKKLHGEALKTLNQYLAENENAEKS